MVMGSLREELMTRPEWFVDIGALLREKWVRCFSSHRDEIVVIEKTPIIGGTRYDSLGRRGAP